MNDLVTILQQKKFKILLIGDTCIDRYIYGVVDRISPEAPVPVLKLNAREEHRLGMAGNVYQNLKALYCDVFQLSASPSKKTRFIDVKTGYQLLRVDEDVKSQPFEPSSILSSPYDAIVISDYNKGFVTYSNVQELRKVYDGPIFIDTKKNDLQRFDGCFVKINETEFNRCTSTPKDLIVTLGSKGAMYKEKLYSTEQVEVHDVTGAGDVFLASLATFYLYTGSIEKAIPYVNKLASISVTHKGTYTITNQDLNTL